MFAVNSKFFFFWYNKHAFLSSGKLVSQEHFGGFLENSNYVSVGGGDNKSWKERMEELITKSKKEKVQK